MVPLREQTLNAAEDRRGTWHSLQQHARPYAACKRRASIALARLLKQVVNEAAGAKNTGGVAVLTHPTPSCRNRFFLAWGTLRIYRKRERFFFFRDSGCSKFPPARPQEAGRPRRTLVIRRTEARD